jgi:heat shock protein HspQ
VSGYPLPFYGGIFKVIGAVNRRGCCLQDVFIPLFLLQERKKQRMAQEVRRLLYVGQPFYFYLLQEIDRKGNHTYVRRAQEPSLTLQSTAQTNASVM